MYKTTITELSVHRKDDSPIFGATATKVRIDDEAGGQFMVVTQDTDERGRQEIFLDFEEVDLVYSAIKQLINQGEFKWGLPDE